MSERTIYLAVGKGKRTPKAVPRHAIGYWQANARSFYEAKGLTAAAARTAIKQGALKPTWENGKRVAERRTRIVPGVEYVELPTGMRMRELLLELEAAAPNAVLRIGSNIYQPQRACRGGVPWTWHKVSASGFTYDTQPISLGDADGYIKRNSTTEGAIITDGNGKGFPIAAFYVAARAYRTFGVFSEPCIDRFLEQCETLEGRRFRVVRLLKGDRFEACDATWSTWGAR